jgi:hypothetical protein
MSKVQGPYEHHDKSRDETTWRVILTHKPGDQSVHHFSTKKDAAKAIEVAREVQAGGSTKPIPMRAPDGTLEWSCDVLDKIAKRLCRNPNDLNLQALARTMSQVQSARSKSQNQEQTARKVASLEKAVSEITSARKKGIRSQGSGNGVRTQRPGRSATDPSES